MDYQTETLEKLAEEIGKLNFQKMLIYNKIKEIDLQLEELKVKVNPLKDRINLRKAQKLLETRKIEFKKFQYYNQVIENLNKDYVKKDSMSKK